MHAAILDLLTHVQRDTRSGRTALACSSSVDKVDQAETLMRERTEVPFSRSGAESLFVEQGGKKTGRGGRTLKNITRERFCQTCLMLCEQRGRWGEGNRVSSVWARTVWLEGVSEREKDKGGGV